MLNNRRSPFYILSLCGGISSFLIAEDAPVPVSTNNNDIGSSALPETALPTGMTLDDVLRHAATPPPQHFPPAIHDNAIYSFTLIDQLEMRVPDDQSPISIGWDANGWIGYDLDKIWWKQEGEATSVGTDHGETETDLLYARLLSPYWYVQVGVQYANRWQEQSYNDTWSGVVGIQGLMPYQFEVDAALYISERADVSVNIEVEYDIRITQRLVFQPRVETSLQAQDRPEDQLGVGISDISLDLRLRYELRRKLAPYIGIRSQSLVGKTRNIAQNSNDDTDELMMLAGIQVGF